MARSAEDEQTAGGTERGLGLGGAREVSWGAGGEHGCPGHPQLLGLCLFSGLPEEPGGRQSWQS